MPANPLLSSVECYRIAPGSPVDLSRIDPDDTTLAEEGRAAAEAEMSLLNDELEALQELLWARQSEKVLVVLQGMDTAGKDGVIRHVFDGVNPLGVRAVGFKVPTAEERARDFLWRVHARVPGAGELVIFNRSHYEDVLVVRVRGLAPKAVWQARYRQIVEFERLLAETGTTILKFYLHISKGEQKKRLEERIADPAKRWKFNPGDLDDRAHWKAYRSAYEAALEQTSTASAPWYVVPADKKWYRNLVIARTLVGSLRGLRMKSPQTDLDLAGIRID